MMQQYDDAKAACGDALLLFRMGDFYELFFEDAKVVARVLGLTLTSRDKGVNPIPMAGFPYHQLDGYLAKLIQAGYRCAVCEQVEDPKQAKGLVRREVTRVVSAGTVTDDSLLDPKEANYLLAICEPSGKQEDGLVGIAWTDLSTGRFFAATIDAARLTDHLARIRPSEVLLIENSPALASLRQRRVMVTTRPAWTFGKDEARRSLQSHFSLKSLEGLGFESDDQPAIRAAGGLLGYLLETQKQSLSQLDPPVPYRRTTTLEIDEATRRSLELTRTIRDGKREGSLLAVLDRCVTPMGSRMLAEWLADPLTDPVAIDRRLDAVEYGVNQTQWSTSLRQSLQGVYDLQRVVTRIVSGRATPRDLSFVSRTLSAIPAVQALLDEAQVPLLSELRETIDAEYALREKLDLALEDDCPLQARDGGFIRPGYDANLDELRALALGGKEWIASYQASLSEQTGIPNLKVGYNKVFGYYLEVTAAQADKVPDSFIRKQTIKNAERYITPELKEYEDKVLSADERAKSLEYDLFAELRQQVFEAAVRLKRTAYALANLDVVVALAELARRRNYCRPRVTDDSELNIVAGRHPVLDSTEADGTFVPNDVRMSGEDGMILLITGPNMAGKSTYIRQVALLTLMAQLGSFVPAREASIGIADRIFARVGASDDVARGQSTFMVEMTETARILNTATPRSLVILDEIGRGTSTYDGVSLAWAIVEHLHDRIGCRTLFATHYHELTDLQASLGGVRNLTVSVKEWEDQVVFLHKIVSGAADKSYGIHVARLAGVPKTVNQRATEILRDLEHQAENHVRSISGDEPEFSSNAAMQDGPRHRGSQRVSSTVAAPRGEIQLTLFGYADHPVIDALRAVDVDRLSPMEALQLLAQWHKQVHEN